MSLHVDLHSEERIKTTNEMYLKAILILQQENGEARATDLANVLGIKKSSVSEMLKRLSEQGDINYAAFKPIEFTPKGKKKANKIFKKYDVFKSFLEDFLSIPNAHDEACLLEHAASLETVEKLESYMKKKGV